MAQPVTFEIDGVRFEIAPLPVDDACVGMDLLTSEGMAKISKLARMFATVSKISRNPDGTFAASGLMVDMKPFIDDAFRGRLHLMVAFVEKAVKVEYGDFLARAGVEVPEFTAKPPTP